MCPERQMYIGVAEQNRQAHAWLNSEKSLCGGEGKINRMRHCIAQRYAGRWVILDNRIHLGVPFAEFDEHILLLEIFLRPFTGGAEGVGKRQNGDRQHHSDNTPSAPRDEQKSA